MIKTIKIGAKTSQILGKNLAKVKGGGDAWDHHCLIEITSVRTGAIHCSVENITKSTSHHTCGRIMNEATDHTTQECK